MSRTKQQLREQAKQSRAAIPEGEASQKTRAIRERLGDLLDGHTEIMIYVSKDPEVETQGIIADLLAAGKRVIVPIIERETCTLRLSYLNDLSVLVPSTFSVPEPIGHEIPARPADVEVVVVPMLAYDQNGNRLGYGAGYYDRFLERYPHPVKIGIAYACQEVAHLPAEPNDVTMDYIVTETAVIECNHQR
jgi:5-formyltetrahydrofolate cyclo-ligase